MRSCNRVMTDSFSSGLNADDPACQRRRQLSPKAAMVSYRHEHTTTIPMTLGNMRANGVRSLDVSCWQCHHRAILSADPWLDHVPVPTFGPRMVCTRCGILGADARPNCQEQPQRESLRQAAPGAPNTRRVPARCHRSNDAGARLEPSPVAGGGGSRAQ
jgi:hypothetical protein